MTKRVFLLVSLSFALASGCGGDAKVEGQDEPEKAEDRMPPSPNATRVESAVVQLSSSTLNLRLPGEVKGSREANLAAALGGFVERVYVEAGETVREGQILARVDSSMHTAQVKQVKVELDTANRELERAEQLGDAIAGAQSDAAKARVSAAKAAMRLARTQAKRAIIRAPFSGTVADVNIERGEVAAPGMPLIHLLRLDPVHVTVSVPDRDVVALRPGMGVQVRAGASGTIRQGKIKRINPSANKKTRAFAVEVELPNEDRSFLPGMIANVEISESVGKKQIVLPQYALVTRLAGNGVYTIGKDGDANVARWRSLEIGDVIRNEVIIKSGLTGGEEIIVTGHRELAEGDRLLVVRKGQCCVGGKVEWGKAPPKKAVAKKAPAKKNGQ